MNLKLLLFLGLLTTCNIASQNNAKEYTIHTIAFYNVENLNDTINDPNTRDEFSPILTLTSNKTSAYWSKINNIAKVISNIGRDATKNTPSLLGLAEVENETVLNDLINSKNLKTGGYDFVHLDSPDWRGMDVALLYKKRLFDPVEFETFELKAFNEDGYRIKTRAQLLVTGYLDDELIHIIITHWPSQRSGKEKTAYLRFKSAELSKQIIDELRTQYKNPKIILMGDFNDNPSTPYFKEILITSSEKTNTNKLSLYNPFESLYKNGFGTIGFRDNLNLFDQIMVSQPLTTKNYSNYQIYKSGIFNPNYLIQNQGKYKGYPLRSWDANKTFTSGYSDHYPVFIYLIKEL